MTRYSNLVKWYMLVSSLAILFLGYKVLFEDHQKLSGDLIRTKGIIIEDSLGRGRILIGAPVPVSKGRVRTDTNLVKKIIGERYFNVHRDYYSNYSHLANGLIILDENGVDRVVIGDPIPDPNIGPRIGPGTGMAINDPLGMERSGYNLIQLNEENRMVLGLDGASGQEGIMLFILENGMSGLLLNDPTGPVYLGKADSSNWFTDDNTPVKGLIIRDSTGVKHAINAYENR